MMRDEATFVISVIDYDGNISMSSLSLSKKEVERFSNPQELVSRKLHNMVSDFLGEVRLFTKDDE